MGTYPTRGKYILNDDHTVTECLDLVEWAIWFDKNHQKKIVKNEMILGFRVSTVFLGIDYNLGCYTDETPMLFETMVFEPDSWSGIYEDRCSTYDEALQMHDAVCKLVSNGEIKHEL